MFEDRGELSRRNYPRGELSGYLLIMSQTTSVLLLKTSLKLHVQQTTKVVDTLLENDTLQNIYNYLSGLSALSPIMLFAKQNGAESSHFKAANTFRL